MAFYLTGTEDEGKAALLAVTDLNEFNVSDDRYKISWAAENTLTVGFEDGANYRQLTIPIDRSRIEE
ncbi:unknown [Eubacterium sp. CAG:115]|nr:unknown [Eubacterium sp. CAG:115]